MSNEQDDDGVARRRRLREASCSEDLEAGQAIFKYIWNNTMKSSELRHGGSRPGKKPNLPRDFDEAESRFERMYFSENPLFDDEKFRRRFRVSKSLFKRIISQIAESEEIFFHRRQDALGKPGIAPVLKVLFSHD